MNPQEGNERIIYAAGDPINPSAGPRLEGMMVKPRRFDE